MHGCGVFHRGEAAGGGCDAVPPVWIVGDNFVSAASGVRSVEEVLPGPLDLVVGFVDIGWVAHDL